MIWVGGSNGGRASVSWISCFEISACQWVIMGKSRVRASGMSGLCER